MVLWISKILKRRIRIRQVKSHKKIEHVHLVFCYYMKLDTVLIYCFYQTTLNLGFMIEFGFETMLVVDRRCPDDGLEYRNMLVV